MTAPSHALSTAVRRIGWALLMPFAFLGGVVEFVAIVAFFALLRVKCALGWHSWSFEPWLHVPFYGTGQWQCGDCFTVRVKP